MCPLSCKHECCSISIVYGSVFATRVFYSPSHNNSWIFLWSLKNYSSCYKILFFNNFNDIYYNNFSNHWILLAIRLFFRCACIMGANPHISNTKVQNSNCVPAHLVDMNIVQFWRALRCFIFLYVIFIFLFRITLEFSCDYSWVISTIIKAFFNGFNSICCNSFNRHWMSWVRRLSFRVHALLVQILGCSDQQFRTPIACLHIL